MLSEINRTRNGGQAVQFFFFYFMSFKKPDHYIDCKALSELKTVGPINEANDLWWADSVEN